MRWERMRFKETKMRERREIARPAASNDAPILLFQRSRRPFSFFFISSRH